MRLKQTNSVYYDMLEYHRWWGFRGWSKFATEYSFMQNLFCSEILEQRGIVVRWPWWSWWGVVELVGVVVVILEESCRYLLAVVLVMLMFRVHSN